MADGGWKRRLDLPLILWSVVVASAICQPPSAVAQTNDPAHQQFLFAYKLLQRGDDKLAADAFDDYLGRFPSGDKRGDAAYYRALLFRKAGQNDRAAQMLANVPSPQLVPGYAVELLRGQVYTDLGRYDEAVKSLSRIDVASLKLEVAVSALYLRGLAQQGAKNLAAAEADLRAAAERDSPMKGRALLDLARVQVLLNRHDDALVTLRSAMEAPDASAAAEAARIAGDLSYNAGRYDDAVTFYHRVIQSHGGSKHFAPAVIGSMWAEFSAGRHRAVLELYERHQAALPVQDRVPAIYLAGSAQQELGNHTAAVAMLTPIANADSRYALQEKVLYKLAVSQYELGQYDAMYATINRLTTQFPQSDVRVDAAFLVASADAKRGDVAGGAARLTQLIGQGKDHPYYLQALLRRARLYETNNRLDAAAQDYAQFLQDAKYRQVGTTGSGQPQYEPDSTQSGAFLQLLDVYQRTGKHDAAATLSKQWLDTMRLPPMVLQETLYRRALSLIPLNQPKDALALLDRLQNDHPLNPFANEASYYRGLLLLSLEQPDQATPLLQKAGGSEELAKPLRVNALRLLALRQRNTDQAGPAAATLAQIESLGGVDALTDDELLWLSRHHLERDDAQAALKYATPLVEGRPKASQGVRAEALYRAGMAHRRMNRLNEASRLFEQVVAMGHGFDLEAQLELARVAADRGQHEQALAELSGLINSESSPIAAEALYTSAMVQRRLAAEHRRRDNRQGVIDADNEARRLLKRLVLLYSFKQLEPLPQLSYLELAEISAELEEFDAAKGELRELIEKYPHGPYAIYARAVLAADEQRLGDSLALLRTLDRNELDARLAARVEALLKIVEPRG